MLFRSAIALTALVLLAGGCTRSEPTPRNAILITIDTLRADHLGCYGYDRETSPRIDELASRSLRFANAVSVSSWTLPAHASLLTGLYPAEHGVQTDVNALPPSASTIAAELREHGFDTFAAVSHVYLSRRWGFDKGFTTFEESAGFGAPQMAVAERIVDSGIEWLEEPGRDDPFFMWLHIFDPHWDYAPPAPYDDLFDPDYRGSIDGTYQSLAPYIKAVRGYTEPPPLAPADLDHIEALYDGEIAYVDAHIGRLLDRLRTSGLEEETLVVIVSDHGEEFMEHGSLEGHQWTLYDEVVMVPLIIHVPGTKSGRVIDQVVSTVGVAGTILDLLGFDSARPNLSEAVGRAGGEPGRDGSIPAALLDLTVRRGRRQLGLRSQEYKLIRYEQDPMELFADPQPGREQHDLAGSERDVANGMSHTIDRRLREMNRLSDAGVERLPMSAAVQQRLRATGYLDD